MMTLTKSQYQLRSKGDMSKPSKPSAARVLQEINNDDEFVPLANITTIYLPLSQTMPLPRI